MENLTYAEVGALLLAVGKNMILNDLCAGAATDMHSTKFLVEEMSMNGVDIKRAEQLVNLDLHVAVDFIEY